MWHQVCEHFDWCAPSGKLKEMSFRVAMLAMHCDGRIALPPPGYLLVPTPQGDPQPSWQGSVREIEFVPRGGQFATSVLREIVDYRDVMRGLRSG